MSDPTMRDFGWSWVPEERHHSVQEMIKRFAKATEKTINPLVAYTAWDEHSNMYAAGWLHSDDTDEVVRVFKPHADPGYGAPDD